MPRENLGESPPNGAGRRHPEQHRPPLDVPSAALTDHRLAELVPEMAPDEYGALVADIAAHGLLEPIVTFEGGYSTVVTVTVAVSPRRPSHGSSRTKVRTRWISSSPRT
jgi:hypothetical protein